MSISGRSGGASHPLLGQFRAGGLPECVACGPIHRFFTGMWSRCGDLLPVMVADIAQEEPTQGAIRALLGELVDGIGPLWQTTAATTGLEPDVRAQAPLNVAYLLPGLPPEGSGGSHSLVQEARGLRALGARARVCVPENSLATASVLYGNEDELFVAYPDEGEVMPGVSGAQVREAVADADVAVATEYPSVDLLALLARERPRMACAYYVQDYEPLFAAPASHRADRALLSYRTIPGQLLFAKTRWLADLVSAIHGVPVAKVRPSLDRELFHAHGRVAPVQEHESSDAVGPLRAQRPPRVAAMIRPRTPRRRPAATLAALALVKRELGEAVEIVTFGCDRESFARLDGDATGARGHLCLGHLGQLGVGHLGLLSRAAVAGLMRSCEVFLDGSAYQAFGRTGLEAMACGAVPVLPDLGGVHEYARHDENALILDDGSPQEMAAAVISLVRDPARLAGLRDAGVRAAQRFSIERAARSQLELFAAAARRMSSTSIGDR
jgi:glycosyltransferase involved in cell wall biosynthesis